MACVQVEAVRNDALQFRFRSMTRWPVSGLARAAVLLTTVLVALATASPAFAAADVTYTFSGTLGPSDADTNSLDVEGSVTGPATGSCPAGSGSGGAGCPTSWSITIDGQTFTQSNSSQINGSISQGYINFDLGSYPAPFGENGCNYLPLPNIPLDDPDQWDTDWGQDFDCTDGHTMFTVNFLAPNFDMNHDGGLYERDAETVTSFILVGGNTAPVITSNGGGATAAVNAAENQTAVTAVEATDTEDDAVPTPLTFSITGGVDAGKFDIGSASGILTFKVAPDFETPTDSGPDNVYVVEVTVTDSGLLTDVQVIAVTVTDVAETGTVTIVKITSPVAAGDSTFTFASSAGALDGLSITTIGNSGNSASEQLAAGQVTVTEDAQTGWTLADIACTGDDDASYDVANRVVTIDLDADEDVTCTFTNRRDEDFVVNRTQAVIHNFLARRADRIVSAEPDLVERLTGGTGGSGAPLGFSASGTSDRFNAAFATSLGAIAAQHNAALPGQGSGGMALLAYGGAGLDGSLAGGQTIAPRPGFDVWLSGQVAHTEDDTRESDFAQINLGADYLVTPSLLIGVLAQVDWMDETDAANGTAADGVGWMAGPYVVARLSRNLIFDGRVAWGQSDNHVDPLGLYVDTFETDRLLARAQLTGDFRMDKWRFSPHVAVIHFKEDQKAYTDSLGFAIPGQTVTLGRVTFGPQLSYIYTSEDGTQVEPNLGVTGIWDYDEAEILDIGTGLAAGSSADIRASVKGGLSVRAPGGLSLSGDVFYDGIGADDLEIYGGSLKLRVPIN